MSIKEAIEKLRRQNEMIMHDKYSSIEVEFFGKTYDLSLYPECKQFVMSAFREINERKGRIYELESALNKIKSIATESAW